MFPKKIFITGTDTGVGKTFISALLLAALEGVYWKPIQAGKDPMTDTEFIQQKTQLPSSHFFNEQYVFKTPCSPHLAAKMEKISISLEDFSLPKVSKDHHLIIEGCGGVFVPINDEHYVIDLIKKFNIATLIVSRTTLGTINHTLLTLEHLRKYDIPILGVILNGPPNKNNKEAIEYFGNVTILGEVDCIPEVTPSTLKELFFKTFKGEKQYV